MNTLMTSPDLFDWHSKTLPGPELTDEALAQVGTVYVSRKDKTEGSATFDPAELEALGTTAAYVTETPRTQSPFEAIPVVLSNETTKNDSKSGGGMIPESAIILEQWTGEILAVGKETFIARISEQKEKGQPKRGEISLQEVAEQIDLVVPGALLSWIIGYRLRGRTRSRFSEIYIRRLPAWTEQDLRAGAKAAEKLSDEAGWC